VESVFAASRLSLVSEGGFCVMVPLVVVFF